MYPTASAAEVWTGTETETTCRTARTPKDSLTSSPDEVAFERRGADATSTPEVAFPGNALKA